MTMKPTGRQRGRTRQRLLSSARILFAQKGYRDATIAEICEGAGANIAAVNYHFGDKETLYVEAWRTAFHRSLEKHPLDDGMSDDAPPERRLRGWVRSFLGRVRDPENDEFEIIHKEMANPTGLLAEVMRESIQPLRHTLMAVVRELLGPEASRSQVLLCMMSIRAQCFDHIAHARSHKMPAGVGPPRDPVLAEMDVEVMADHVVCFSLAGIREVRRRIERGEMD